MYWVSKSLRVFQEQKLERRAFLLTGAATSVSLFFSKANALEADFYRPRFFTSDEMEFLDAAAECIYPEDKMGPGAKALKVSRYIDIQMTLPYGFGERTYMKGPFVEGPQNLGYQLPYCPRNLYRKAIASLDRFVREKTKQTYIERFKDLDRTSQIEILTQLQNNEILLEDIPSAVFFSLLRSNVLEGVFADPLYGGNLQMQGWNFIGFPGARADFMQFVNQRGAPYPYKPVGISVSLERMQKLWKVSEEAQQ